MYTNELIPRQVAEQAVGDYALLYTKVEGSKQYVRKQHAAGLQALREYKKALASMILGLIPTVLFLLMGVFLMSIHTIAGVAGFVVAAVVFFKFGAKKVGRFFKSLKGHAFAKQCEKELLELNNALGGKQTAVWTDAFRDEVVSLVGKFMYKKYANVQQRITAFNQKYRDYRDFVNLDSQWSKAPVLYELFKRGLATSLNEALREYERQKDAEEIKGLVRATQKSIENMASEVRGIRSDMATQTAAITDAIAAGANQVAESNDRVAASNQEVAHSIDNLRS